MLNDWQKIIVQTYRGGDYAHLFDEVTSSRGLRLATNATNDELFICLMNEFWVCPTYEEAKARLLVVQEEVNAFASALVTWKDEDA